MIQIDRDAGDDGRRQKGERGPPASRQRQQRQDEHEARRQVSGLIHGCELGRSSRARDDAPEQVEREDEADQRQRQRTGEPWRSYRCEWSGGQ